jgi:hypothetical protein
VVRTRAEELYVLPVNPKYFKALQRFCRKRWNIRSSLQTACSDAASLLSVGQIPDPFPACKAVKKTAIASQFLITNIGLHAGCTRFNLQLLEYLKHQPGNQSRST